MPFLFGCVSSRVMFYVLGLALNPLTFASQVVLTDHPVDIEAGPHFSFSADWHILGPFQIGTREAAWGSDPLEFYGGFHILDIDDRATYPSSLAANGTVRWTNHTAQVSSPSVYHANVKLHVSFPELHSSFLQDVYGWAAQQWQGWARGQIVVEADVAQPIVLQLDQILELWIDDEHFFGGDFYGFHRAPLSLTLAPGTHRIDVRLVRDVRAFGGIGQPTLDISMELTKIYPDAAPLVADDAVLVADVVEGRGGQLTSPYASVSVRNDGPDDVHIYGIEGLRDECLLQLVSEEPLRVVPGQIRPVAFKLGCIPPFNRRFDLRLRYLDSGTATDRPMYVGVSPRILLDASAPQRITYLHPGGMVSYAILRPPPKLSTCNKKEYLPIVLALHGAAVEADSDQVKHSLDALTDLCAWILFPSGVTSWSSDDWHNWGMADIEAAVDAITDWVDWNDWKGPKPDIHRWIVVGHSNGGQGTWYSLVHQPDRVIAAAPLSGYSSIQSYVPYSHWRTVDPGREAIVQGALLSYRHELLLENAKDIPIYVQHGEEDHNVPAYHSRLLSQGLHQARVNHTFIEFSGQPHWWDGVMTTPSLRDFLHAQVKANEGHGPKPWNNLNSLSDFNIVSANPGDTGSKHHASIVQLIQPGRIGRLDFIFDPITSHCTCFSTNVNQFRLEPPFSNECDWLLIDDQPFVLPLPNSYTTTATEITLTLVNSTTWTFTPPKPETNLPWFPFNRHPRQQGGLEAILRTQGAIKIVTHTPSTSSISLQISRNFHQYFGADTEFSKTYDSALEEIEGNIISVGIGADIRAAYHPGSAIELRATELVISIGREGVRKRFQARKEDGLAAVFVRAPQRYNERLELVVWGVDEASVRLAARLVPLLTGTGLPDFVIFDRSIMWKGLDGVRALGFFDGDWRVSGNSFV